MSFLGTKIPLDRAQVQSTSKGSETSPKDKHMSRMSLSHPHLSHITNHISTSFPSIGRGRLLLLLVAFRPTDSVGHKRPGGHNFCRLQPSVYSTINLRRCCLLSRSSCTPTSSRWCGPIYSAVMGPTQELLEEKR